MRRNRDGNRPRLYLRGGSRRFPGQPGGTAGRTLNRMRRAINRETAREVMGPPCPLLPADDLVAFVFEALLDKPSLHRVKVPGTEDAPDKATGAAPGRAHSCARPSPTDNRAPGRAYCGSRCGSHGSRFRGFASWLEVYPAAAAFWRQSSISCWTAAFARLLEPGIRIEHRTFGRTSQA